MLECFDILEVLAVRIINLEEELTTGINQCEHRSLFEDTVTAEYLPSRHFTKRTQALYDGISGCQNQESITQHSRTVLIMSSNSLT